MPPRNLNVILLAILISALCHVTYRRARPAMIVGEALDLIDSHYVEAVDDQELLSAAMKGMTSQLDRHSEYIPIEEFSNLQDSINQEFTGIGILIEQPEAEPNEPKRPVRIVTPLVRSPARKAGLLPGDEIVEIDGRSVAHWDLNDVSKRLKGPIDSSVDIVVRRGDEEVPVTVRRARIEMESVIGVSRNPDDSWNFRLEENPAIAYVRLTSFGEKTADELSDVLRKLNDDFDGLVLDLRGNGGGLLYAAVAVSDMFLDSGMIVSTKLRGGVVDEVFEAEPGTLIDRNKPVVVLIDGNSASASEIVAASLQDLGRAAVAGTRSYGKGTVQNVLPLQYGRSALRLTIARYYRPSDKNIHRAEGATDEDEWGVRPNPGLEVELDEATYQQLLQRWRNAAYPMLAFKSGEPEFLDAASEPESAEEPDAAPDADGPAIDPPAKPPESPRPDGSLLDLDPQLRRAVDYLLNRSRPEGSLQTAA